ncbi:unnamed protein product, partial [Closterium sp. NIES-54]
MSCHPVDLAVHVIPLLCTSYSCCPRHTPVVHVIPLLCTSYSCCPRHNPAVHIITLLSTSYPCCPRHNPAAHVIPLLSTSYPCCPRHNPAAHVIPLLSTSYPCCPRHTPAVHVIPLLPTSYPCCPRHTPAVHGCSTVTVGLYVKKEDLSEDYYSEEGEQVGEEEGEEVGKAEEGVRKERKGSAEDGSGSDGGSDSESSSTTTTTTTSDWDTPSKGGSNGARGSNRRGLSKWARRRRAKQVEEARRSVEGKRLVAFGRAYSDGTLTAAVHDIAVAPIYRGRGLGTRVLQRILRELLSRGIGDISAVVWPNQR